MRVLLKAFKKDQRDAIVTTIDNDIYSEKYDYDTSGIFKWEIDWEVNY